MTTTELPRPEYGSEDLLTVNITVGFKTPEAVMAFVEAMTGNDDDIVLLMEKVANERLGADHYEQGMQAYPPEPNDVIIGLHDVRDRIEDAVDRKVEKLREEAAEAQRLLDAAQRARDEELGVIASIDLALGGR